MTLPVVLRLALRLRRYWWAVVLAYLALLGSVGFTILIPWLVRAVIDRGIDLDSNGVPQGSVRQLIVLAGLIVLASALRGVFAYCQSYMAEFLSQRVAYDLRNDLYEHIQRLSFSFHDRAQTGQLMSRATVDVDVARMFLSVGMLRAVYTFVLFGGVLVIMLRLDLMLALVLLLSLPLVAFQAIRTSLRVRPLTLEAQQKTGEYTAILQENLTGIRMVKAYAREEEQHEKFQAANWAIREKNLESSRITAFNQPLMLFMLSCSTAALLLVGGRQVIVGAVTIGTLVAFLQYRVQLAAPVRTLGMIASLTARTSAAGERIFEILDARSDVEERPGAIELSDVRGRVCFEDVSFRYDPRSPVVQDITIGARPGQMIALLGPTGSGKSTVLNLLPRFYDVTDGRITIDGHDIRDVTLASLRREVGIVLQDVFLFSATVRDNIAYGRPDASREEIEQAAKAARIHDFIMTLPEGYDTWVGERGVTLSGGQKQRIAIARTLLLDPRILVLDDSTSSVDVQTEFLIQQALTAVMRDRTSFAIAHRLRTIRDADQILVLRDGCIIQRGTHAELVDQPGLYREIYDLQFRGQEEAKFHVPSTN
ncbi:MAG: ABC transporter ATP-binding protein [Dehalococcoidia bacterium]